MLTRLFLVFMVVAIVRVYDAQIPGGWQTSHGSTYQTEMINLARAQLNASGDFSNAAIDVVSFETQVVAGTNLRLVFVVGNKQRCTLAAFKPLPYTKQPIQVKSFNCED